MSIGDRIRIIRGKSSQASFAKSLDIAQRTLANYERNKRTPNVTFALSLAQKFSISFDWLLTGEGPMKRGEAAEPPQAQPQPKQDAVCPRCERQEAESRELRTELSKERDMNRELITENRQLWKESGQLKVKAGELNVENVKLTGELDTARTMAKEYYKQLKARASPDDTQPEATRRAG